MATENPRVWFKSISLENVRSFGTKQKINFTDKAGNVARWNVILGDNGTGKTTVLKGLVILAQNQQTVLETGVDFTELWRFNEESIGVKIDGVLSKKNEDIQTGFIVNSGMKWGNGVKYDTGSTFRFTRKYEIEMDIFAYNAARRISSSAITEKKPNYITNFFSENNDLINAEEWLVQADYISLKEPKFKHRFDTVLNVLKELFSQEASDIYISTETGTPKVFFKTNYGDVRLHELSLGYKTLIAWMVDFAKGLLDRYPDSENPLAEPAVCLVDEIDLHLHPKFQRNIIKFLTETFPNTQFIVTAHSPLIVVAAEEQPQDTNIILLKREGDQTVVVNDSVDVSKWSVDQILNSDLFGHVSSRSEPLTELRTERDTLLSKQALTATQKARLDELDTRIGFVPVGRDQAEIQAETIIQQLADILRSKQQSQ
ncbi:AAA family ATPase [Spirosoma endbachense]|uniref:AAA family ATPase n=1 Tax=Spirosoma endbachense TaxID=2666025 RepID=A0A6P1W2P2_9BACT|nr:ATP-binding protein [Spirosoma endbachense]QHV98828.1 AAA family ATPase [Spirosoma endbachense]